MSKTNLAPVQHKYSLATNNAPYCPCFLVNMISKLKNQPKEQTKERKSGLKNMKNTKVDHFHHSGTQTQSRWNLYAKVKEILQEGRSYNLITDQSAQLRRNRVMLCPIYEVTSDESSDKEEADSIHENSKTSDPDVHYKP